MKGKKTSDVDVVREGRRVLQAVPHRGAERGRQGEGREGDRRARGRDQAPQGRAGGRAGSGSGSAARRSRGRRRRCRKLGDVKVRGLVVIETEPQNATIYLDDKKKGAFATTPWSGSLDGEHKIIIEKRGYKAVETTIVADPTKLVRAQGRHVARRATSAGSRSRRTSPGADIYIDDKIDRRRRQDAARPAEHQAGQAHVLDQRRGLRRVPEDDRHRARRDAHGQGDAQGLAGRQARRRPASASRTRDDHASTARSLCEHGPCLKSVPRAITRITVTRPGYKPYTKRDRRSRRRPRRRSRCMRSAEAGPRRRDRRVRRSRRCSRGGGIYLGLQANELHDELKKEIDGRHAAARLQRSAVPAAARSTRSRADARVRASPASPRSPRIYYTFRDKGPPTTRADRCARARAAARGRPDYAGLGMEVHW